MNRIMEFLNDNPMIMNVLNLLFLIVVAIVVVMVLLKLEKKLGRKLLANKNDINLRFVESAIRAVIIFVAVQWVMMSSPITESFGKVLFQGTTIIGAIAGFAAQPVVADMICGLMISAAKPFDIGDRIELDNGTAGIVKDITLRHVVIQTIDTVRVVIPNSKLNAMLVTNMSFQTTTRSVHFRFNVAYGTDVERVMSVIRKAVESSPYSIAGKPTKNGGYEYGPVYFINYADSSLVMATTVYFEPKTPSEVVKSDINTRVNVALKQAGIEIPYNYVNVVMHSEDK
ncbi:MAG: mechanosensitive ion channel family protein [Clostridia bacterium]|nr:mechanosensitive ion channel family protein [Clostridia bacterium]